MWSCRALDVKLKFRQHPPATAPGALPLSGVAGIRIPKWKGTEASFSRRCCARLAVMSDHVPSSTEAVLPRYGEPMVERRSLSSAIKAPDTWWPTLFAGPAANRLVGLVRDVDGVTPNRITAVSLAVGLLNGALYAVGTYPSTLIAGLVVQLSFILDCADGQLSRVRGTNSLYGFYIDKIADRMKVIAVFFGIAAGIERSTKSVLGWRLAVVYVVCHLVCDLYREAYRGLSERVREKPTQQEPAPGWLRALSILDFPFIRFAFGDVFFLLTVASVLNQLVPFLAFEAMTALLQTIFRPIYLILHFRRTTGVYPWAVSAPGPLR